MQCSGQLMDVKGMATTLPVAQCCGQHMADALMQQTATASW